MKRVLRQIMKLWKYITPSCPCTKWNMHLPCFHQHCGTSSPKLSWREPLLYTWWIQIPASFLSLGLGEAQLSRSETNEKQTWDISIIAILSVSIQAKLCEQLTSPKVPKYSWMTSFEVSGLRPPTKIFLTGSFFMAMAFLGSICRPSNLCSFCSRT